MTAQECARLQSLDELPRLPELENKAFKALGNAVNAYVVELIADALLSKAGRARSKSSRSPSPHDQFEQPPIQLHA